MTGTDPLTVAATTTAPAAGDAVPRVVVGPLLRYVDAHRATVWVEVDRPCVVRVVTDAGPETSEQTWAVHGHHYAVLVVVGLPPGSDTGYRVELDGATVWPEADSPWPPSLIRVLEPGRTFRLAFGSCRRSAPADDANLRRFGADALEALAARMAHVPTEQWPNALLMAGDQVYADEPSPSLLERLRARHAERLPRGEVADDPAVSEEISDFEEYTWLYEESWNSPGVRWLQSTVPTCMLLDDHDLRDDWNTSWQWREHVTAQPWWHDRVVGAFASYWVYQHLGNLSPDELATDPLLAAVRATDDDAERDRLVDDFAWRSDAEPKTARWSYHRDFGPPEHRVRLLAVDSRCSRRLDPDDRAMVDDDEWQWIVERTRPDDGTRIEHLLLASTLPVLTLRGVHHLEGWNEAVAAGAWGPRWARAAEHLRQAVDLEHWAAFRSSLDDFVSLLTRVVDSPDAPSSLLLLSGDVHCSYTARARLTAARSDGTAVHQLVMSPFRNPLELPLQLGNRVLESRAVRGLLRAMGWAAGVRDPAVDWDITDGPWFDNGVMTVVLDGPEATLEVDHADVRRGRQLLRRTRRTRLTPRRTDDGGDPHRPVRGSSRAGRAPGRARGPGRA